MRISENISVFEDTMKLCKNNKKLREAILQSIESQKVILETEDINIKEDVSKQNSKKMEIIVSKKRSFEAASAYKDKKVCVHNFASASNPGGGVTKGAFAQEECLCRISTLYPCISDGKTKAAFHDYHRSLLMGEVMTPLYNDDCIYTPGVVVFKRDEESPALMPESNWYTVDVITCAAPNLRSIPSNRMNSGAGKRKAPQILVEELKEIHKKRMRRILDLAKKNGAEVVILGAFGCGAFQNPPEVVAEAYREILPEYENAFEMIEFAVYCSEWETINYDVFDRILRMK